MGDGSVTVAILAGGQGRRLGGVDKGLEILHGKPLIGHVCDAVRAMSTPHDLPDDRELLILANRNIDRYSSYAKTMTDDAACGQGPLAGVATALSAITSPWLLTVPVDCPNPPLDLWQRLHASIGTADCAVAHDGETRQPLFALYRGLLKGSAKKAALTGVGPWTWQDQIAAVDVDFSDRFAQFSNLNTAADFGALMGVASG